MKCALYTTDLNHAFHLCCLLLLSEFTVKSFVMALIHVPSISLLNMSLMIITGDNFILKWSETISEMLYLFQLMGPNPKHGIRNYCLQSEMFILKPWITSNPDYSILTVRKSLLDS